MNKCLYKEKLLILDVVKCMSKRLSRAINRNKLSSFVPNLLAFTRIPPTASLILKKKANTKSGET